jgi:hypothetical protein
VIVEIHNFIMAAEWASLWVRGDAELDARSAFT